MIITFVLYTICAMCLGGLIVTMFRGRGDGASDSGMLQSDVTGDKPDDVTETNHGVTYCRSTPTPPTDEPDEDTIERIQGIYRMNPDISISKICKRVWGYKNARRSTQVKRVIEGM